MLKRWLQSGLRFKLKVLEGMKVRCCDDALRQRSQNNLQTNFSAFEGTLGWVPPKGCESHNVCELGLAADDPVHETGGNVKTVQSRDCNAGTSRKQRAANWREH